ncbi:Gfo/Idh/MocA family oxidoreductase [Frigidibacter sp. SD6-1]|uniref:Gfo/Idh/MocA family protein n=1 Tax=Frigidibacter sp. SD6-1 TaxID=3032581 RepID=UPI0024DF6CDC|nr:Gfo/Idh/MocA family oxidoreductase [Frigidibacter sp. SD6-1]
MTKETLNVAVIGSGIWGAQHAHVFSTLPNTRLVAVCDVNRDRAEAMAKNHDGTRAFTDHREMLAMDGIDAVTIATPDFTHTPLIVDALDAGKHVLSEKPLATSVEEAEAIRKAADASDRKIMVDFHNRVSPAIATAQEEVAKGTLGKLIHGSGRLSNTTFVPLEMLSWAGRSSALWFLGSHLVDALRFILDDDVVRVFAMRRDGYLASKGVDTADVHLAMLEFSRGTVMTIENSWVLSPDNPQVFDLEIGLVGEKGQIQLNPSHNGAYRQMTGHGLKYRDLFGVTPVGVGRVGGFVFESIARFVDAVLTDAPLLATVEDGLRVTRILSAIEDSASSGRPVDIAY